MSDEQMQTVASKVFTDIEKCLNNKGLKLMDTFGSDDLVQVIE